VTVKRTDMSPSRNIWGAANEWREEAACTGMDTDIFFPLQGKSTVQARKICGRCLVRADCLNYAITTNQLRGMWGGMLRRDRYQVKKMRMEGEGEGRERERGRGVMG